MPNAQCPIPKTSSIKRWITVLFLILAPLAAFAHIGSPGVTFEGQAGPYAVLVLITPPDVIPGTARVDIYATGKDITAIWGKPVYWHVGDEGTPSADPMTPVPGEPGHYTGMIWLMSSGTSGIDLKVEGQAGTGTVLVPVMAVSTAQRQMPASLGYMLVVLAVLLVVLMVTVISTSVSDGLLKPGAEATTRVRRKRWIGAVVSTVLLLLVLWGGKNWWDSWAAKYQRFLYKPMSATSTVVTAGGQRQLELHIDRPVMFKTLNKSRRLTYVVPDHGKLMHMFLVRAGSMDVFAHLHPQRRDSATYVTPLPPLPQGTYLVFADITRLSGFAETIPDTLVIDQPPVILAAQDSLTLDRDDTYFTTDPITGEAGGNRSDNIVMCGRPGVKTALPDGSTAIWEHQAGKPFEAGRLYELTFAIQDEKGKPAALEPYLGMMGHAVVMKTDGSVYIHLHPVGSYSMASQQTMLTRFEQETGPVDWASLTNASFMDSVDHVVSRLEAMPDAERNTLLMAGMPHAITDATHPDHSVVKFPYAFPAPGSYRIWIQMKRNGKILNSAFDAIVE